MLPIVSNIFRLDIVIQPFYCVI